MPPGNPTFADDFASASLLFQTMTSQVEDLRTLDGRLEEYAQHFQTNSPWQKVSAGVKMTGSALKLSGAVLFYGAPLFGSTASYAGNLMWQAGTGMKFANSAANFVKDLWQGGWKTCLSEFIKASSAFMNNLFEFQGSITAIEKITKCFGLETRQEILDFLKPILPEDIYKNAGIITDILLGSERFYFLMDFSAQAADPTIRSSLMDAIRELKSFAFLESASTSNITTLMGLQGLLHISRELYDFIDGLKEFTQKEYDTIQNCLAKFMKLSKIFMHIAIAFDHLNKDYTTKTGGKGTTKTDDERTEIEAEEAAIVLEETASILDGTTTVSIDRVIVSHEIVKMTEERFNVTVEATDVNVSTNNTQSTIDEMQIL